MCGIVGFVSMQVTSPEEDTRCLRDMADQIANRGPDDSGVWFDEATGLGLGHRRLSIIDIAGSPQPMESADGRAVIVFNGEIYNFLELRAELEREGYRFRSGTDTEVILAAYDQWGVEGVHRFVGMFAFALWDEPRRRLWVVRDRLGKSDEVEPAADRCARPDGAAAGGAATDGAATGGAAASADVSCQVCGTPPAPEETVRCGQCGARGVPRAGVAGRLVDGVRSAGDGSRHAGEAGAARRGSGPRSPDRYGDAGGRGPMDRHPRRVPR